MHRLASQVSMGAFEDPHSSLVMEVRAQLFARLETVIAEVETDPRRRDVKPFLPNGFSSAACPDSLGAHSLARMYRCSCVSPP